MRNQQLQNLVEVAVKLRDQLLPPEVLGRVRTSLSGYSGYNRVCPMFTQVHVSVRAHALTTTVHLTTKTPLLTLDSNIRQRWA